MAETIRIGLQPVADRQWMGGVNYIVNIACATKKALGERVSLNLCLTREWQLNILGLYAECFPAIDRIVFTGFKPVAQNLPKPAVFCPDVLDLYSQLDFVYPGMYNFAQYLEAGYPSAGWLTDFQHKYLPEFFTAQELAFRDTQERQILSAGGPVFFSSRSALEDARRFYPDYAPPMRVLHFHTAAADDWYQLDPAAVRAQHGLPEQYFICCNQFWMHKNHGVLFEALRRLKDRGTSAFLACTGDTRDNRSADYFPRLQQQLADLGVTDQVRFLGVIPRAEQIALVRGSLAVLQPSRFEGWSTVVEDSRLLGKTIFLSAIPVHQEQAPEHGVFFDPLNGQELADKLREALPNLRPGPDLPREEKARREGDALVNAFGRHFYELAREACYLTPPPYGLPADMALPELVAPYANVAEGGKTTAKGDEVTVATVLRMPATLSPDEANDQRRCVESWFHAGFFVLSCNPAKDLPALQQEYPQVRFLSQGRQGLNSFGLGTPRLSDLLRQAGLTRCAVAGLLSPDVFVRKPERLRALLREHAATGTAVFLRRQRIITPTGTEGLPEPLATGGVFLPRAQALNVGQTEYQFGAPGWEMWLALLLSGRGVRLACTTGQCGSFRPATTRPDEAQLREKGLLLLRKVGNYLGFATNPTIPGELRTLLTLPLPVKQVTEKFFAALWKTADNADADESSAPQTERERQYILLRKREFSDLVKNTAEAKLPQLWQSAEPFFEQLRDYEKLHGFVEDPQYTMEQAHKHLRGRRRWSGKEVLHAALYLPATHLPAEFWPEAKDLRQALPFFVQYVFRGGWALDLPGEVDRLPGTLAAGYDRLLGLLQAGAPLLGQMLEACFNNEYVMLAYAASRPLRPLLESRARLTAEFNRRHFSLGQWQPTAAVRRERIRLGVFLKVIAPHTETYATIPFFDQLDRKRFEIRLYVAQQSNTAIEQYAREHADSLTVLQGNLNQRLDQLRAEDLDLFLIGTNVTAVLNDAVLFGLHRVARRQLVQFCQPYTTALPCVDDFIAGENLKLKPEDFTEQLRLLSGSGICFSPGLPEQDSALEITRRVCGIPEGAVAFFSGANYFKLRVELLDAWARLLARNPQAVLVLLPFGPAWSDNYPQEKFERLLRQACARNGAPVERVRIIDKLPSRSDVRRLIALCDIYLDSFPYSGATSLLDPFTLRMPVVAMRTPTVCGGQGAAILEECRLHELVAANEEEYLTIAGRLAADAAYRQQLQEKIGGVMQAGAPFHNLTAFGAKVQTVYETVYEDMLRKA